VKQEGEAIEIPCAGCGASMKVHQPHIVMNHSENYSQALLVPSWSTDERKCKNCGAMNFPIIMNIQANWAASNPEEKKSSIVSPGNILLPKMELVRN
jgi:uncharacterized Zn finger protein